MKALTFAMVIAVAAAADAGDDFTNNVFTDLAPLLALFGEQFSKQFMSQSMDFLDHIIFAMAPLGILTAIVSAIRVGGPSWLKAVVGRARENRATVEVELMSSTSHEVCELWNGQGIVRTLGRPKVQQILYLEALKDNEETCGLYTVESAGSQDEENTGNFQPPDRSGRGKKGQEAAPNITLNLHGTKRRDLYLAAICGILLQSGMLVFSGFTVYHPGFKQHFLKDKRAVRQYAFPCMATGTFILTIGMMICSAVVEQSTKEKKFVATEKYRKMTKRPTTEPRTKLNARILWLQKSGVVGDQTFDSAIIFGRNKIDTREKLLSNIVTTGTATENFTTLGVILGLTGFILQFQGLRGMNWSASISQLVCILLMTIWRAFVRRSLGITPDVKTVFDQHEMDWLALR
ncbi:hypothetical protein K440DRAFT_546484, partial [Wilcoxina mikolae CBS 423.85]